MRARGRNMSIGLGGLIVLLGLIVLPARAAELVMFDQAGCYYCAQWDAEIGPVYPKTAEGRQVPLRRIGIHDDRPADLGFIKGVRFTPTFVLVEKGAEIGRIEGYPGEMFFWGLLDRMIRELPAPGSS